MDLYSAPPPIPRRTTVPAKQPTSAPVPQRPARNRKVSSPDGQLYLTPLEDSLTSQTDIAATVECFCNDAGDSPRSDEERKKSFPVKAATQALPPLPPLPDDDSTNVGSRMEAKGKDGKAVDTPFGQRYVQRPVPKRRNMFTSTVISPENRLPAPIQLRSVSFDDFPLTGQRVLQSGSNAREETDIRAVPRKSSETGSVSSVDGPSSKSRRPQPPIRSSKLSTSVTEDTATQEENTVPVNYFDVMPLAERQLEQQPWFFGNTSKEDCDERLKSVAQNGAFVVRRSRRGGERCPYTMTLYLNETTVNLSIRRRPDDTYALGSEKADEIVHNDVMELVSFHRINPIKLQNGKSIKLFVSPSK